MGTFVWLIPYFFAFQTRKNTVRTSVRLISLFDVSESPVQNGLKWCPLSRVIPLARSNVYILIKFSALFTVCVFLFFCLFPRTKPATL